MEGNISFNGQGYEKEARLMERGLSLELVIEPEMDFSL